MKINWGTSIVIAFGLFMAFILYFVILVQRNPKYDNELVVEEYYKHDAHYGEEMVKLQNAQQLKVPPMVSNTDNGIIVIFPDTFNPEKISGLVSLYRPSNKKLDFTLPLQLTGNSQRISKSEFAAGLWNVSLQWNYEGKAYLIKKNLYLN